MPPEICPNCGEKIPPRARACPNCGSDEQTGWSEQAHYDSLDLPSEDFDYEEFVKSEFGGEQPVPRGISWFWWGAGLLVLAVFVILLLR